MWGRRAARRGRSGREPPRCWKALADPDRGFDAIVIGEFDRAFCADQLTRVLPVCDRHQVPVWLPEFDGPVDGHDPAHPALMMLLGADSRREVQRSRYRVTAAMAAQAREQGRYLGGRTRLRCRASDQRRCGPHGWRPSVLSAHGVAAVPILRASDGGPLGPRSARLSMPSRPHQATTSYAEAGTMLYLREDTILARTPTARLPDTAVGQEHSARLDAPDAIDYLRTYDMMIVCDAKTCTIEASQSGGRGTRGG